MDAVAPDVPLSRDLPSRALISLALRLSFRSSILESRTDVSELRLATIGLLDLSFSGVAKMSTSFSGDGGIPARMFSSFDCE